MISSNFEEATTWYLFFNSFDVVDFKKDILFNSLNAELSKYVEKFSAKSLQNDIDVLLNMYSKDKEVIDPEDKNHLVPNPETAPAFELAVKLAKKVDADVCIATDPDADRMGVWVRVKKGQYVSLNGNELESCILEYVSYFKNKTMNFIMIIYLNYLKILDNLMQRM